MARANMARAISRFFSWRRQGSPILLAGSQPPRLLPSVHPLPFQLVWSRGVASKLFIGGLSFYTTEDSLSDAFSQFGQVIEAKIIMDKVSQRSKGYGFVTFASEEEAQKAITDMNGQVLMGRVIYVETAKSKPHFRDEAGPIARGPPDHYESN